MSAGEVEIPLTARHAAGLVSGEVSSLGLCEIMAQLKANTQLRGRKEICIHRSIAFEEQSYKQWHLCCKKMKLSIQSHWSGSSGKMM